MAQFPRKSAQAEQSVPHKLIVRCAWCDAEAGDEGPDIAHTTHTICYQHLREMRRIVHDRRERIERLHKLLS